MLFTLFLCYVMATLKKSKLGTSVFVKSLGLQLEVKQENAAVFERNGLTELFENDTTGNKGRRKKSSGNVDRVKRPADAS